jgi:type II secretory pathway component PulF
VTYSLRHKAALFHQLYIGIKAGLPLKAVLDASMLPMAFRNKQTATLPRLIDKGRPLSAALVFVKAISAWESRLLAVGENAGRVENVLADLESFYLARYQQLSSLKAKLLYPAVVVVVGTLAGPAPQLARGELTLFGYGGIVAGKLALCYCVYHLLVVLPFERAAAGAFNPLLVRLARQVDSDHWLRQLFEVGYLNVLTTCLESGLAVDESLKLLRDGVDDAELRQQHINAISQVQKHGTSLAQTLTGSGILRNHPLVSFVNTAEQSGTLHSDLRQYVARRRGELDALVKYKMTLLGRWLYFGILLLALVGYF